MSAADAPPERRGAGNVGLPWWRGGVFYQIYPRSFLDTDGDGVGDLEGIRRRLGYLADLGVDALWLSPFYRSPMADFGYDVSDYCDVDPLFGSLDDFRALLSAAHAAGLRMIVDFVPNHTSSEHPWFLDARSSRSAAHRDWYVWRDGDPAVPPNRWMSAFTGGPAWTFDDATEQWYLHLFLPEQPDLDWDNPAVEDAMHDILRFWLDLGVDGFRIDVAHLLGKDIVLGPDAPDPAPTPRTHEIMRRLRRLVDSYDGDRMLVGEIYILSTKAVARFYGAGDELHLAFNFPPLYAPWAADKWRARIDRVREEFDPVEAWPTWVLSNHDNPRHRTRYGTDERARAAILLLVGLQGTPFLYAGEELGLSDAVIPPERVVDPGGRDGCRAPIPWTVEPAHGWATTDPWLPWPPSPSTLNAATEVDEPGSMLSLYRTALAMRRTRPALSTGSFEWLESPTGVLAWTRREGRDRVAVAVNFGDGAVAVPAVAGTVLVASDPGVRADGWLPGSAAAWFGPED